ncbi:MAG: protein kinase [Pirellulales bacterium]|nr:protein kinase [Pirellulales bacterium]
MTRRPQQGNPTRNLWAGSKPASSPPSSGDGLPPIANQDSIAAARKALQRVEEIVAESESQDDPLIGRTLGKYQIQTRIGRGGMGSVYQAWQTRPVQRKVALKLMNLHVGGSDHEQRRRFVAEGQLLASIQHREIACVFDADTTEQGEPYFVMELADGVSLTQFCESNRLSVAGRIKLVQRICRAVDDAHQQGIVHRDLKPDNILVAKGKAEPIIKVIDFGIAKILAGHRSIARGLTAQDQFIGTPGYVSPEQATGSDVDARSDVFSLGAILFELLCGSTPINRTDTPFKNLPELRQLAQTFQPPRPSRRIRCRASTVQQQLAATCRTTVTQLLRQCQTDLDWVVLKALHHDRTQRYATAADFADDLQRVLDAKPTRAAAPTLIYRARKFGQRHPAIVLAGATLMMLAAGLLFQSRRLQRQQIAQTLAVGHQCDRLLDQVDTLRQSILTSDRHPQSNLTQAAVTLQRSKDLLDGEPTLAGRRRRWHGLQSAIAADTQAFDFVSSLDSARQKSIFVIGGEATGNLPIGGHRALQAITAALDEMNLHPDITPPALAADDLGRLPAVLLPHVIEAFDFCIGQTMLCGNRDRDLTNWYLGVLTKLDPNPDRTRLRFAVAVNDVAELGRIVAEGLDHRQLPFSRVQLAAALGAVGKDSHAIAVLRRAQRAHPEHFWVNHHLAVALSLQGNRASAEESVRFFTVAAALRPEIAGPSMNLAIALASVGRNEEAFEQLHRAAQIDPATASLNQELRQRIEAASPPES